MMVELKKIYQICRFQLLFKLNFKKGFTLIELLVVVAIIGILAAVGVVAYNGYTNAAKKAATEANFKLVVNGMRNEIMKCELGSDIKPFEGYKGLSCPITINSSFTYIAQWFSYENNVRNPLTGNLAVRPGNGEQDGEVSIVACPRNPYCPSSVDTNGKWKVMWWYDNKTMQGSAIIDPNL